MPSRLTIQKSVQNRIVRVAFGQTGEPGWRIAALVNRQTTACSRVSLPGLPMLNNPALSEIAALPGGAPSITVAISEIPTTCRFVC